MSAVDRLCVVLGTGLGLGRFPVAPGTVGTLGGIPLAWGIAQLPSVWSQGVAVVVVCLLGVPICTRSARALGGAKDPGSIVFDEIAGLSITFFLVDLRSWPVVVAGFLLFRLFDITKPPPARQLERLPAGLGIMADDWMAGVYANLALRLVLASGVLV